MQPDISWGCLFLYTAKEVWDAGALTYSKVGNAALKYDLKRWMHGLTQGDILVATYFHKLRSFWQELDHCQNLQPMCAVDAIQIKKMIEEECIFEFLGGLNSKYDPMCLFHHYKRFFLTFKIRRVVVALCFIPVHRPNPLLWVHLNNSRFRDRDRIAYATSDDREINYSVTIIIGHDILEKLVGIFRAILPKVVGVA